MHAVIVGCGRLGSGLANILSAEGHDVVVVDRPLDRRHLGAGFDGLTIEGDPIDQATLELAGVRKADLLVAATADDNVNAATAQAAKDIFGVPEVIARFVDPERERFYQGLGLATFCPTTTGLNQVLDRLRNHAFSQLAAKIDPAMTCVLPEEAWIGRKPREIRMPAGRRIVGLVRGSRLHDPAEPLRVRDDDTLVVARRRG